MEKKICDEEELVSLRTVRRVIRYMKWIRGKSIEEIDGYVGKGGPEKMSSEK